MDRTETAAGLAEVMAAHEIPRISREAYCSCGAPIGNNWAADFATHVAAVVLAHLEAQGWAQVTREQVVVEADAYRDDAGNMPIPRRIGPFPSTRAAEEYMRTLAPLYGSWNTAPIFKPAEDADG